MFPSETPWSLTSIFLSSKFLLEELGFIGLGIPALKASHMLCFDFCVTLDMKLNLSKLLRYPTSLLSVYTF